MHAFVDSDVLALDVPAIIKPSPGRTPPLRTNPQPRRSTYQERQLASIADTHPYKISDVAAMVGVTQRTLRFYEELHLISPKRISNTRRRYSDADVAHLQKISHLAYLGFSLVEVKQLLKGKSEDRLIEELYRRQGEVSAEIEHLHQVLGDISREISRCGSSTGCPDPDRVC